ncbi:hypothetical protein PVK06_011366 [Gossypium arboreum]|uniref:Uncharacterized protein n=1 Tax=Gossypium arboreum TaxID=29729 RepID=A0ABR0Q9J5_GOSAR|nr:hypothetical protein PVK06_011366 [Gossypium arboreum]
MQENLEANEDEEDLTILRRPQSHIEQEAYPSAEDIDESTFRDLERFTNVDMDGILALSIASRGEWKPEGERDSLERWINKEKKKCISSMKIEIYFAHPITNLCRQAGVVMGTTEQSHCLTMSIIGDTPLQ